MRETNTLGRWAAIVLLVLGGLFTHNTTALALTTCPTAGTNVTISTSCTFDPGTYTFNGTLTVSPGVTITHGPASVGGVVLVADFIDLEGNINANGVSQASTSLAPLPCGPGAHAAIGFGSNPSVVTYGDPKAPLTLGSQGFSSCGGNAFAPKGGGAVKLQATYNITLGGTISANSVYGGAGGSVWLQADQIVGTGSVSANGGVTGNGYAAGGGGRVAFTGYTGLDTRITASAKGGGTIAKVAVGTNGDLLIDELIGYGVALPTAFAIQWTKLPTSANWVFDSVGFKPLASTAANNLYVGTGTSLTVKSLNGVRKTTVDASPSVDVAGTLVAAGGNLTIDGVSMRVQGGTLNASSVTISGAGRWYHGDFTATVPIANITVTGTNSRFYPIGVSSTATPYGGAPTVQATNGGQIWYTQSALATGNLAQYGAVTVNSGSKFVSYTTREFKSSSFTLNQGALMGAHSSASCYDLSFNIANCASQDVVGGGRLNFNVGTFTVQNGADIIVHHQRAIDNVDPLVVWQSRLDGCYVTGTETCTGMGTLITTVPNYGTGGSHYGKGEFNSTLPTVNTSAPTTLGRGSSTYSGDGGGAVHITATTTVALNGNLRVDDETPYNTSGAGLGGGAGGSLWITAPTMTGAGWLTADGGAGTGDSNALQHGGCGGGGMVRLDVPTLTGWTGKATAKSCRGGGLGLVLPLPDTTGPVLGAVSPTQYASGVVHSTTLLASDPSGVHGCDYSINGGTSWTSMKMLADNEVNATGSFSFSFPLGANTYQVRCHDIYNNPSTTSVVFTGITAGTPAVTITSITPASAGNGGIVTVNASVVAAAGIALQASNPVVLSNTGIAVPASGGAMTFVSGSTAAGGTSVWTKAFTVATIVNDPLTATVSVSATGANAVVGIGTATWLLTDNTPPDTFLDQVPNSVTTSRDAVLMFHGSVDASTFSCSLDGAAYTACSSVSTQSYTSLAVGSHTFAVRAVDKNGNIDATPASVTWQVVNNLGTTPTPTICSGGLPAGCFDMCGATTNLAATAPTLLGAANYMPTAPAGTYLVKYSGGCMKYNGAQWWTVNAKTGSFSWYLVANPNDAIKVSLPGTEGYYPSATPPAGILSGYSTLAACVSANTVLAPVAVNHPGGPLGIWLLDQPYSDNSTSAPPLSWDITRIAPHGTCPP